MKVDIATDSITRDVTLRPPLRARNGSQSSFEIIIEPDTEHRCTYVFNTLNVAAGNSTIKAPIYVRRAKSETIAQSQVPMGH